MQFTRSVIKINQKVSVLTKLYPLSIYVFHSQFLTVLESIAYSFICLLQERTYLFVTNVEVKLKVNNKEQI